MIYSELNSVMEVTPPENRADVLRQLFPYVCKRSKRYRQRWGAAYLIRGYYPASEVNLYGQPALRATLTTISSVIDDRVKVLEYTIGVPRTFLRLWERKQGFRMLVARRWLVEGVGCIDTLLSAGEIPVAPERHQVAAWEVQFLEVFGLTKAPRSYMSEALAPMTVTTRGQLASAMTSALALLEAD